MMKIYMILYSTLICHIVVVPVSLAVSQGRTKKTIPETLDSQISQTFQWPVDWFHRRLCNFIATDNP